MNHGLYECIPDNHILLMKESVLLTKCKFQKWNEKTKSSRDSLLTDIPISTAFHKEILLF